MESDLALRVALPTRANSVGKNFDIRVEIRNCSSSVHPGGVLTVQEQVPHGGPTSYLRTSTKRVAAILPFSTVSLVVEVSILASASLETLAQGLLVDFAGVSQACALFPGDFLSPFLSTSSSTETYNLLLFGWSGATKSSFINSCATLFEKRLVMPAVEGGTSAHCTVKLQPYALPNTSIVLWDTWGVTLENYHGAVLRALLDGAIPAGTDMSSLPQVKMPTASDNTMHNVLFFFPAAAVADPAMDSVREILRDHYFACRRKGRRPVILLSKIDEQSIDVRQCPASMCAKTEELKQKLLELLKEDVRAQALFHPESKPG